MRSVQNGHLPWLCPSESDFKTELSSVVSAPPDTIIGKLTRLALQQLDLNQLTQLDRKFQKIENIVPPTENCTLKVAILAQATTDYMVPAVRATGFRYGLVLKTYTPAFGQSLQEILDQQSRLRSFDADITIIAESPASLGITKSVASEGEAEQIIKLAYSTLESMIEGLKSAGQRTIIIQNLPYVSDEWSGNLDSQLPGAINTLIDRVNIKIREFCRTHSLVQFDVNRLANVVGLCAWHDPSLWHRAKIPFSIDYIPLYADKLLQLINAMRGKAAKCLVLDLDNTCWGGVIGDDGIDGIKIGQGSSEGEAFLAIQNYALSLKNRGIVLAICSKNEESNAKLPFEKHPDMLLRLEDIAVFVANWTDKASNLAHIAKILNIGIDALVFVDDNPAERARVRQELPQVRVPEVGEDPSYYPSIVSAGGYFESIGLSDDDTRRADQYRENARRTIAMETIGNYDQYLESLEMVCSISGFDSLGRTRITQLINKSNQFNLTTRRYSEAEVAALEKDQSAVTLQIRLKDKFGDNGMISVVILKSIDSKNDTWLIDTWLMSCRVLKRRVEEVALDTIVKVARRRGIATIYGDWLPSDKNSMVEEHYCKLGFTRHSSIDNEGVRWKLAVDCYQEPDKLPLKVNVEI